MLLCALLPLPLVLLLVGVGIIVECGVVGFFSNSIIHNVNKYVPLFRCLKRSTETSSSSQNDTDGLDAVVVKVVGVVRGEDTISNKKHARS